MEIQGLEFNDSTAIRKQPSEDDLAKAALLSVLAEGKPYVFLMPELGSDENGQYVLVTVGTDITDPVVLKAVLDTASDSLGSLIDGEQG
jgi:hypothetical protein